MRSTSTVKYSDLYLAALTLCILFKPCTSLPQNVAITTISTAFNFAPCGDCQVFADFTTNILTSVYVQIASPVAARQVTSIDYGVSSYIPVMNVTLTETNTYIVFTAYSVVSTTLRNSSCIPSSGPRQTLSDGPFSVPLSPGISFSQFEPQAESSFIKYVGYTTCYAALTPAPTSTITAASASASASPGLQASPINSTNLSPATQTSTLSTSTSSNSTPTNPNAQKPHSSQVTAAITVPPIILFSIILFMLIYWRRHWKHILAAKGKPKEDENQTQQQAYLQQKAELDAEGKQQYEMEALNENIYELPEGSSRHELPTQGIKRQELKGEEHCCELTELIN